MRNGSEKQKPYNIVCLNLLLKVQFFFSHSTSDLIMKCEFLKWFLLFFSKHFIVAFHEILKHLCIYNCWCYYSSYGFVAYTLIRAHIWKTYSRPTSVHHIARMCVIVVHMIIHHVHVHIHGCVVEKDICFLLAVLLSNSNGQRLTATFWYDVI